MQKSNVGFYVFKKKLENNLKSYIFDTATNIRLNLQYAFIVEFRVLPLLSLVLRKRSFGRPHFITFAAKSRHVTIIRRGTAAF